ncbi:hypothetical protein BDV11DRAFT_138545 [Aspergillus similis]
MYIHLADEDIGLWYSWKRPRRSCIMFMFVSYLIAHMATVSSSNARPRRVSNAMYLSSLMFSLTTTNPFFHLAESQEIRSDGNCISRIDLLNHI